MPRWCPNPGRGMLKGVVMSPVTTPAQALWECRERWRVAILVTGRREVHYCSRSVTLPQTTFDVFVRLLYEGYPADRRLVRQFNADKVSRQRLRTMGICVMTRDRWIKGEEYRDQPKARPRPVRPDPRKYKLSLRSLARLSQFGMDTNAT